MTPEAHEALIRRFYEEVWNRGDLSVFEDLFADNFAASEPGSLPGPEGEKRHVGMIRAAFPDMRITIDEMVAGEGTVAARWTMTATDLGGFLGRAPTGRRATFWGVDFFRFADDRIVARWAGVDMLGLMIQLGIVPSPWQAAEQPSEGRSSAS